MFTRARTHTRKGLSRNGPCPKSLMFTQAGKHILPGGGKDLQQDVRSFID